MDELFECPVSYKGEELFFPAQLKQSGYTHRFVIDVYEQDGFFEPDEERNYRAIIDPEPMNEKQPFDLELLNVIAETIRTCKIILS